jgi:hypothetical protein
MGLPGFVAEETVDSLRIRIADNYGGRAATESGPGNAIVPQQIERCCANTGPVCQAYWRQCCLTGDRYLCNYAYYNCGCRCCA